jgi:hypothetical protein
LQLILSTKEKMGEGKYVWLFQRYDSDPVCRVSKRSRSRVNQARIMDSGFFMVDSRSFVHPFRGITMKKTVLLASLLAAIALTACGKKEEAPVAAPAAPAVEAAKEAAGAAVDAAKDAGAAAADAGAAAGAAAGAVAAGAADAAATAAKDAAGAAKDAAVTATDAAKEAADKAAEAAKAAAKPAQ